MRESSLAWGAAYGALAWGAYGVVEYCAFFVYPLIVRPSTLYTPYHWIVTGFLFLFYLLLGSMLGVLTSLAMDRFSRTPFDDRMPLQTRAVILATLSLTFVSYFLLANQEWIGRSRGHIVLVCLQVCLVLLLLIITISTKRAKYLHFTVNPWFASFTLVGLPWLGKELIPDNSGITKAAIGCSFVGVLVGLSMAVGRFFHSGHTYHLFIDRSVPRLGLQVPLAICFALVASLYLERTPPLELSLPEGNLGAMEGPNIILVTMDTVRADHTSAYNYPRETTPALEDLARESTLYLNAIAPGDMTLSTHASLFTGLPVNWHGAHRSDQYPAGQPLAQGFDTLSEVLANHGYLTAGVVANHGYLGHRFGLDQGFHYYDDRAPISYSRWTWRGLFRELLCNIFTIWIHPSFLNSPYRKAEQIHSEALKLIEKLHKRNRPWFLFLNYMDAHTPYQPPPPFDTRFPSIDPAFTWRKYREMKQEILRQEYKITTKEKQHLLSLYDAGIAYLDHYLGIFLEQLKKRGLYEGSLIIVTSDHGEAFGERELIGHEMSVYQDQVHVPLLVKYPNSAAEMKVSEIVSLISIPPTVLEVTGLKSQKGFRRMNLRKIPMGEPTIVVSESYPHGVLPRFERVERAVFRNSYKFIHSTEGKREFYDLSLDPNETQNLYKELREESRALENQLTDWLKVSSSPSTDCTLLDRQTEDRLQSLGYVK
ncbi:sulfatase [Candidatus Bathyarchaeota archaeon]|nr:sulfatase [Candidatus Bathyarchaeota archaeon]